jgi:phage-related protein
MEREIIFYTTKAGNCPVAKFIRDQHDKTAAKITATLEHLEETKQPAHHILQKMSGTDDLWEVRVKQSGNIFRLLGFFDGQQLIILTSAFQKKTQKTPRQEIKTAEARKADYYKQKGT